MRTGRCGCGSADVDECEDVGTWMRMFQFQCPRSDDSFEGGAGFGRVAVVIFFVKLAGFGSAGTYFDLKRRLGYGGVGDCGKQE